MAPKAPFDRLDLAVKCDHCGAAAAAVVADVLRCACGSLLARYVDGALELKCRRCKRIVTVSVRASDGRPG